MTRNKLQHLEPWSVSCCLGSKVTEPLPSQITLMLDVHQASTVPVPGCLTQHVPVMDCCTCKFSHLVGDLLTIFWPSWQETSLFMASFFSGITQPFPHRTHVYLASSVIYYLSFFIFSFPHVAEAAQGIPKFIRIAVRSFTRTQTSRSIWPHIFSANSSIWLLNNTHYNPGWLHGKVRFFWSDQIMHSRKRQVLRGYWQVSDVLAHPQDLLSPSPGINLEQTVG